MQNISYKTRITYVSLFILLGFFTIHFSVFASEKNISILLPENVQILVYHSVSPTYATASLKNRPYIVEPETFEKQIKYLQEKGYTIISLGSLVEAISKGQCFVSKSIVLTFDDGLANQYQYAFPILKKYNLTATFFVYTNPIDHNNKSFMSWDEVKELSDSNMTIGDHTRYHLFLNLIIDPESLKSEIVGSKTNIEKHIGKEVDFFAYPFYKTSVDAINLVKEAGFKGARAGYSATPNSVDKLFTLRATEAKNSMADFSARIK